MKHFPIFLAVEGKTIAVAGGGEAAVAKLRLLMKTEATIMVYASDPDPLIAGWVAEDRLTLIQRPFAENDADDKALVYAATDDDAEDARVATVAKAAGVLTNMVDNLHGSDFITPAIVDRDPVTVAIGTEGAAPVLARKIKRHLEETLSPALGLLAKAGKAFRDTAEILDFGRPRRAFWADWYDRAGPLAQAEGRPLQAALHDLLATHIAAKVEPGHVAFVGAGPGDPELLTLKARNALDTADVVIHDRLVAPEILELARREALLIPAGKEGFGPAMAQDDINRLIVDHVQSGAQVVRLKGGDPAVFGRLDEEIEAVTDANLDWSIVPGITSASAAVAAIGQSLTKRTRNSGVRLITGHDIQGFADHDWAALAKPGAVAAIYMGKRAARFVQGRLLMHGTPRTTPVTVVENASRPNQRILEATLDTLEPTLTEAKLSGPALILFGLAPRAAEQVVKAPTERSIAQL
ncbi:MAG: siroheme synthase CysG [Pseudomonadota bacterium]